MTKPLLLVQPLKIDDISINILADEEEEEQPLLTTNQDFLPITLDDIVSANTSTINNMIDAELLAILGFPQPSNSNLTTPTLSFIDSNTLLDWEDMPELSENEDDLVASGPSLKRKATDDTEEEAEDVFAQFDFEEVNLLYPHQQHQVAFEPPQDSSSSNKRLKTEQNVVTATTAATGITTDFDF